MPKTTTKPKTVTTATRSIPRLVAQAARKPKPVSELSLEQTVAEFRELSSILKEAYERSDSLQSRLLTLVGVGNAVEVSGVVVEVVDPFIDKKTGEPKAVAYKPARFARYSITIK